MRPVARHILGGIAWDPGIGSDLARSHTAIELGAMEGNWEKSAVPGTTEIISTQWYGCKEPLDLLAATPSLARVRLHPGRRIPLGRGDACES